MTDKPLIILASARKNGQTKGFIKKLFFGREYKLIDLLDFHISAYDYSNHYPDTDTFLKITEELLSHKIIVFATPVYWYAMSGLLKNFFDRLTDLVTTEKHLGRQLKGKFILLCAVGSDPELPKGFEVPFELTAKYFNMIYLDKIYYSTETPVSETHFNGLLKHFEDIIQMGV